MTQLRTSVARETQAFGVDALVMHDGTSHDAPGDPDTWAMVARYAVAAAIHGVPRVFMGQPLALAGKLPFRQSRSDMYGAGTADDPLRTPVADLYCRIDAAREEAPEARLLSRYFLKTGPAGGIGPSG